MLLLDQELDEVRFIKFVVGTQEVPRVANVFFSLLKGHLFAYGVGLISHRFFGTSGGIYGWIRSWWSVERVLSVAGLGHGRKRSLLNATLFLKEFYF